MDPKQVKLFVATPMFGGMCYSHYASGLMDLGIACRDIGIQVCSRFIINDPLLMNARNILVHQFLQTDFTHFLFIDADIGFLPNDALSMIAQDLDVIAGTYPMKRINWRSVRQAANNGVEHQYLRYFTSFHTFRQIDDIDQEIALEKPFEVAHAATGFMLIKRKVFEALADKVLEYQYGRPEEAPWAMKKFFDTTVVDGMLHGEDVAFCKLVRENNMKVYIAPWVSLPHAGTFTFEGKVV